MQLFSEPPVQLAFDLEPKAAPSRTWHALVYGYGAISGAVARAYPSTTLKREILATQSGLCIYCDFQLGGWVARGQRPVRLGTTFDHFDPFEYIRANPRSNWVAACHICNGMKGKLMFTTIREARAYISERRHFLALHGRAIRWLSTQEEWQRSLGLLPKAPKRTKPRQEVA